MKGWLAPVRRNCYRAFCKVCDKELIAGLSELKKHQESKKHQSKEATVKKTRSIAEMVTTDTVSEQVKQAEIKMATFVVEHNLPFAVMDHLSDVVKDVFPDSNIASKFKSKHTKTRSIIKNVLAKQFRCDIIKTLRNIKFSIIINESTDISSKKQLAVVVRFFCHKELKVQSQFLCLIHVTQSDATTLTDVLTSYFERNGIPFQNIIGFASDTIKVMFGEHHSMVSLFKAKFHIYSSSNVSVIQLIYVLHMLLKNCHKLLKTS